MNFTSHLGEEPSTPPGSDLDGVKERVFKDYEDACLILQQTRSLLVVTGAGISKESGMPCFQETVVLFLTGSGFASNIVPAKAFSFDATMAFLCPLILKHQVRTDC